MTTFIATILLIFGLAPAQAHPAEPVSPIRIEILAVEILAQPVPLAPAAEEPLVSEREIACLAAAVHFEARGEPLAGRIAVVEVILARKDHHRWPDDACSVIAQHAQFSFVRQGRIPTVPAPCRAKHIALVRSVLAGEAQSAVRGATYFHAAYVSPGWSKRVQRLGQIGDHIFYS